MTKAETRAAARELGLSIADKHDSQDICFVPQGHYAEVIERLKPGAGEAGDIVHIDGRVLGRHQGIIHYTIGQRRGIGVAIGEPLYVVHLDPAGRRVIVGPREALATRRLHLREVNWLGDETLDGIPAEGLPLMARVRSTRPPMPARLFQVDGRVHVDLADGETGVAAGQACVFYEDDGPGARVLGGGWIERTERAGTAEKALRRLVDTPAVGRVRRLRTARVASSKLDDAHIVAAYARWAPVYDAIFGVITHSAIGRTMGVLNALPPGRILEIGVGTGLALPRYKREHRVTGIDLSPDMLARARARVEREKLANVEQLAEVDATRLSFADQSFDAAVAMFLITVVPDPVAVLSEAVRVVKPGGRIVLANHFSAESGPRAAFEKWLSRYLRLARLEPGIPDRARARPAGHARDRAEEPAAARHLHAAGLRADLAPSASPHVERDVAPGVVLTTAQPHGSDRRWTGKACSFTAGRGSSARSWWACSPMSASSPSCSSRASGRWPS